MTLLERCPRANTYPDPAVGTVLTLDQTLLLEQCWNTLILRPNRYIAVLGYPGIKQSREYLRPLTFSRRLSETDSDRRRLTPDARPRHGQEAAEGKDEAGKQAGGSAKEEGSCCAERRRVSSRTMAVLLPALGRHVSRSPPSVRSS